MSQTTLEGQFRKAREKAGRPDLTFKSLRASHATLLMLRGGTLREVMDELGHSSEKVAIKHYQRIVDQHRSQVVNQLVDEFIHSQYESTIDDKKLVNRMRRKPKCYNTDTR